jgi:hypothetical protein
MKYTIEKNIFIPKVLVHKRCVKQLRIVCGITSAGASPYHQKIMDSNGRHTSASSITTNGQPSILNKNQKNENQQQNGTNEIIGRHRPSGASVMNARDPMTKQKMSNICEPGPLKRAQGRDNIENFESTLI